MTIHSFRSEGRQMICSVSGCQRQAFAKTFCTMHYQRAKKGSANPSAGRIIAKHADLVGFLDAASSTEECVVWPFGKDGYGYGCITYEGEKNRAHRVQWERRNGKPVPVGMVVRHMCNNQSCVNPSHLLIGTQADNIRDQEMNGRKAKGERKGGAKLTDDAVREARILHAEGETIRNLAARFGVHEGTMAMACRRETWRHVV